MRMRAFSSAPAAVRMRLHRKRRREGTHYVRIPLESFEIEGLIRLKVRRTGSAASAYARQKALAASPTAPARVQPMSWRSNSLSCLSSRRLRARARHSDNRELPLVTIWLA
jgi:hypothetical protein